MNSREIRGRLEGGRTEGRAGTAATVAQADRFEQKNLVDPDRPCERAVAVGVAALVDLKELAAGSLPSGPTPTPGQLQRHVAAHHAVAVRGAGGSTTSEAPARFPPDRKGHIDCTAPDGGPVARPLQRGRSGGAVFLEGRPARPGGSPGSK